MTRLFNKDMAWLRNKNGFVCINAILNLYAQPSRVFEKAVVFRAKKYYLWKSVAKASPEIHHSDFEYQRAACGY